MRKYVKKIATIFAPVFLVSMLFACNPDQVNTAKNVMQQASFYVDMAEALAKVASTQFPDKPAVKAALLATQQALVTVRQAMEVAAKGLDKDNAALKAAVVALVLEVFALTKAIKDAQAAASAKPATP